MHFVGHHSRTNPPAALVRARVASGAHSCIMHQAHRSISTHTAKADANRNRRQQSSPASRSLRTGRLGMRAPLAEARAGRGAARTHHLPARASRVRLGVKGVLAVLQPHALVLVQAARRRRLARQQGLRGPNASGGARCAAHASAVRKRGVPTTCAGAAERLRRVSKAGSYQDDKGVRNRQAALHCAAATHLSPNPWQTPCGQQIRHAGRAAQPLCRMGGLQPNCPASHNTARAPRQPGCLRRLSAPAHR